LEVSGQFHALATLPPEKSPSNHWLGGWVGSRAGLDVLGRRKIFWSCRESNPIPKYTVYDLILAWVSSLCFHYNVVLYIVKIFCWTSMTNNYQNGYICVHCVRKLTVFTLSFGTLETFHYIKALCCTTETVYVFSDVHYTDTCQNIPYST